MVVDFLKKQLLKAGFEITRINKPKKWPVDFEDWHKAIIQKAEPFTMTSRERMYGLLEAVKYLEQNQVEGDVVECGNADSKGKCFFIAQSRYGLHG